MLCDWDAMVAAIADLKPLEEPGTKTLYLSMTFGWIIGELVRRTDPNRRSLGRFIQEEIAAVNSNIQRILINEITKKGVSAALAAPRAVDMDKTNAQQARRILDRLVGYEISPILWNKVQRGLSAGRVQSVAVRLVCEREDAIRAFVPEEYWSVEVSCKAGSPPPFDAKIWRWRSPPRPDRRARRSPGCGARSCRAGAACPRDRP